MWKCDIEYAALGEGKADTSDVLPTHFTVQKKTNLGSANVVILCVFRFVIVWRQLRFWREVA
jgi:hypothetical protein